MLLRTPTPSDSTLATPIFDHERCPRFSTRGIAHGGFSFSLDILYSQHVDYDATPTTASMPDTTRYPFGPRQPRRKKLLSTLFQSDSTAASQRNVKTSKTLLTR